VRTQLLPVHPRAANAGRNKSLTLAAMSLGFVVVQLDVSIVNVALQSISASGLRSGPADSA